MRASNVRVPGAMRERGKNALRMSACYEVSPVSERKVAL
jgi:hypothetical protein